MAIRESILLHSVAPDLIPADAPGDVWNNGVNAVFRNGETVAAAADLDVFPNASIVPKTIIYVEPFDEGYWVYADESGIYANDGTNEYDITPASWGSHGVGAVFTSCVINGLVVINSSGRAPAYWTGQIAEICLPLPDWPDGGQCLAMRGHKNFLFAVGFISEGGQRVRWSTAAAAGEIPAAWDPLPENQAGFVDLAPLSNSCLDGLSMRDDFLVYKRGSIWRFVFVGSNDIFAVQKVFAEQGIAATNGVGRGPNDDHLFITSDGDIAITNGIEVNSVLNGRAQRTFYADFQGIKGDTFSVFTLMREKIGGVLYPRSGSEVGTNILLFDYPSGDIAFREVSDALCAASGRFLEDVGDRNEWDGQVDEWRDATQAWNQKINATSVEDILFGTETGIKLFIGSDTALNVSLEKSGLAFGDPQVRKLVSRIWPKVVGRVGDVINFRVGGQNTADGPTELGPITPFVIGAGLPVNTFASGRFLTLLVESEDTAPWRMGSIDVEYRDQGGF